MTIGAERDEPVSSEERMFAERLAAWEKSPLRTTLRVLLVIGFSVFLFLVIYMVAPIPRPWDSESCEHKTTSMSTFPPSVGATAVPISQSQTEDCSPRSLPAWLLPTGIVVLAVLTLPELLAIGIRFRGNVSLPGNNSLNFEVGAERQARQATEAKLATVESSIETSSSEFIPELAQLDRAAEEPGAG